MLVIGLTGGIGAGKSSVAGLLAQKGAVVIDADAITRQLQEPGTDVFDAIVERFGPTSVSSDGTLDRAALAEIAFHDPQALADLNHIVHPAVGAEIAERMRGLAHTDAVVVLDIPLLVETGNAYPVSGVLVVDTDPETAVRRLIDRGMREGDVRARVSRQASREERLARADIVIDNRGTFDQLQEQVDAAWEWIQELRSRGTGPSPEADRAG